MHNKTIKELQSGLEQGEFSSVELTQHYLDRINRYNDQTNAFITITDEQALDQAKQADALRASGQASALTGIPIAHKDIFCTEGVKTSCGSKMLDNFIAPYESTVTQKCKDAGLVMLGKTNMDEFAMGSTNESSFYGPCKNPWDSSKIPGGSSGGSAATVAARLAPIATGTDTGGSIRQPASMCNITGLKPTYGRVSRWGMIAYASSFDQAGPMAQTAEDAAILLNVMAGLDEKDSTSMDTATCDYTNALNDSLEGLRIGIPKEYFAAGLNESVKAVIESSIKELEKQGAIIKEISLSTSNLAVPSYYVIAPAEASANLSRFDGVRFGYRCENPEDLQDLYTRSRGEGFGDEVKRRIMVGAYALSAGYYDAYYKKAQQVRRLIKNDFLSAFNEVDVIAAPTAPTTAFNIGEINNDPVTMYLEDIFTLPVNLAGLPAITVPAGFADGMPTGLQLIGNYFQEAKLLNIGHKYQQATDWHLKTPEQFN